MSIKTIMTSGGPVYDYLNCQGNMGSVSAGEEVTALWQIGRSDGYFDTDPSAYIEYNTSNGKKRGYIPTFKIRSSDRNKITLYKDYTRSVRYVTGNPSTYYGPGSNYVKAGSLSNNEKVVYLNKKENTYALVEYWSTVNNFWKHAWVYANNLRFEY